MIRQRAWREGIDVSEATLNFRAGVQVALGDHPVTASDIRAFHAVEQTAIDGTIQPCHYSYPPVTMLLTAPLALLTWRRPACCCLPAGHRDRAQPQGIQFDEAPASIWSRCAVERLIN